MSGSTPEIGRCYAGLEIKTIMKLRRRMKPNQGAAVFTTGSIKSQQQTEVRFFLPSCEMYFFWHTGKQDMMWSENRNLRWEMSLAPQPPHTLVCFVLSPELQSDHSGSPLSYRILHKAHGEWVPGPGGLPRGLGVDRAAHVWEHHPSIPPGDAELSTDAILWVPGLWGKPAHWEAILGFRPPLGQLSHRDIYHSRATGALTPAGIW